MFLYQMPQSLFQLARHNLEKPLFTRSPYALGKKPSRVSRWKQQIIFAIAEAIEPNFRDAHPRCKKLLHRLISGRHTAVGALADFQGASDEHTEIRT